MKFPLTDSQSGKACDTVLSPDKIKDSRNVWINDGIIKSRKGIEFDENKTFCAVYTLSFLDNFVFVDDDFCIGTQKYKIAYAVFREDCVDELCTTFIDSDKNLHFIEKLCFNRLDDSAFYRPLYFNFFNSCDNSGKEKLYLMVMTVSYHIGIMSYEPRLFVYNEEQNSWNYSVGADPYEPVVLMNGRGDSYSKAVEDFEIDEFTPYYPESSNLLSGWCRSYFTSDGYSYRFKTPCEKFATGEPVKITFEDLTGEITWTVPGNSNELSVSIMGESLKILCFREYGAISFVKASGEPYPLPRYYECSNNLLITACDKNCVNKYNNISSCDCSVNFNSKMLMCNDFENSNEIYYLDLKRGLYAPKSACINIGRDGTPLKAVRRVGNRIIAFKENEIYSIDIKYGNQVKYTIFPMKLNQLLYNSDTVSSSFISSTLGCNNPQTLSTTDDTALWLNNDGCVYFIDKNGKYGMFCNIKEPLEKIGGYTSDIKGCIVGDYYVLCVGNKMILLMLDSKKAFIWEFPEEMKIYGVNDIYGKFIVGVGESSDRYVCFSEFSADRDTLAEWQNGEEITFDKVHFNVESRIQTEKHSLGTPLKRKIFESVSMNVFAKKGFNISFDGKNRKFVNIKTDTLKPIKLLPHLHANENIEFTVESNGEVGLGDICINYRTVSDRF